MIDESWIIPEVFTNIESLEVPLPESSFIEQIFNKPEKAEREKLMTLSAFFDCNEEAKYVVTIAKFMSIFFVENDGIKSLVKLNKKEIEYIRNYNFESVLADTNRKQFSKFFSKSTFPMVGLSASLFSSSGLVLFIENPKNENEKPFLKVVNFEGLVHSILVNVSLPEGVDQLSKFFDSRYKRIHTVVCFENVSNKTISKEVLLMLLEKFESVLYMAVGCENSLEMKRESYEFRNMGEKVLKINLTKNYAIVSTNEISYEAEEEMCRFYNKHHNIDNLIFKLVDNSKMCRLVFKENEMCISYYGIFYNFISLNNLVNMNICQIQEGFLSKLILEKNQNTFKVGKVEKKVINRKLGHYPVKLLKGSKACCVCDDSKKKKSRYKCEKCSDTYSRDISICVEHFKEFHENMHKYIPKGVRKSAYENEIEKFKESDNDKTKSNTVVVKKNVEANHMNQAYLQVLSKWDKKSEASDRQLDFLANIFYHEKVVFPNDQAQGCFDNYSHIPFEAFYQHQNYYEIKNEVLDENVGPKIEEQMRKYK